MAGLVDASRNSMLNNFKGIALYASLHTADPGATGTNEVTGGSPAYARKSITWNNSAASDLHNSNQPLFDVPAATVTHVGFWSASSGGTFYGSGAISQVQFTAQSHFQLPSVDIVLA